MSDRLDAADRRGVSDRFQTGSAPPLTNAIGLLLVGFSFGALASR
jgi:hypothetical protein